MEADSTIRALPSGPLIGNCGASPTNAALLVDSLAEATRERPFRPTWKNWALLRGKGRIDFGASKSALPPSPHHAVRPGRNCAVRYQHERSETARAPDEHRTSGAIAGYELFPGPCYA